MKKPRMLATVNPTPAAVDNRRFCDRFKFERARFAKHIRGMRAPGDRVWYAALTLQRLMFLYFLQHKGLLDDNRNYLHDRLQRLRKRKNKEKCGSYYRSFLVRLFNEGLAGPRRSRE